MRYQHNLTVSDLKKEKKNIGHKYINNSGDGVIAGTSAKNKQTKIYIIAKPLVLNSTIFNHYNANPLGYVCDPHWLSVHVICMPLMREIGKMIIN